MPPTIRIDDEVYAWLQEQAVPFDDTPNTVLRRVAGLGKRGDSRVTEKEPSTGTSAVRKSGSGRRTPMTTGPQLIQRWRIPVRQARFHRDGIWYQHLSQFPGAFCDPDGYVVFETADEYRSCQQLSLGQQVNVPGGVSSLPGYVKVDDRVA